MAEKAEVPGKLVVRVINLKYHYSAHKKRLSSAAVTPSSGNNGLSVFDASCARRTSGSVCSHLERYYPTIIGEPPCFWEFDVADYFPEGHVEPTESGVIPPDPCHQEIFGYRSSDKKSLRAVAAKIPITDLNRCDSGRAMVLNAHDLDEYAKAGLTGT